MRSSICAGSSSGTFSSTLVTTYAARSSGLTSTSEPFRALPIGERPNATITASVMDRDYGPVGKLQSRGPPRTRVRPTHFPLLVRLEVAVAFVLAGFFAGVFAFGVAGGFAFGAAVFVTDAGLPVGSLRGAVAFSVSGFSAPATVIVLSRVR